MVPVPLKDRKVRNFITRFQNFEKFYNKKSKKTNQLRVSCDLLAAPASWQSAGPGTRLALTEMNQSIPA
jgi:hypothetical protein